MPRFPLLWGLLAALWLLLNDSAAPAHWLAAAAVALAAVHGYGLLQGPVRLRHRWLAIVRLTAIVLLDIVRSNIAVARIVLASHRRAKTSAFLDIPLELRNPFGLAALACIITANPGTVWASHDEETNVLTLHVLDLVDPAEWLHTIKDRYECRLLEIFP